MKLRPYPWSLNGNTLALDEFGFRIYKVGFDPVTRVGGVTQVDAIEFRCPNGKNRQCQIQLTLGEQTDGPPRRWHWDGNVEAPTITPSIGCDQRCGWHGHITNGETHPG